MVLAEVPLRCSDNWFQGSVKAGIRGSREGLHAFPSLFLLFFDILNRSGTDKSLYEPSPNYKSNTCS